MSVRVEVQWGALICWHRLYGWPVDREVNAGAGRLGFPAIRPHESMLPWLTIRAIEEASCASR